MSQELVPEAEAPPAAEPGRYAVLRCLGVGAKAETYLCQDSQTGRGLVRKFLNPEVSVEYPDIVEAVFSAWAALDHPNVVRVLDFGWEEGKAYLNTEFAEGAPILQALSGAPLPKVWRAFGQLFLALDHLYAHNVPHLDLKPQNVLVQSDAAGEPWLRLVDYGFMPLLNPHRPTESNAIGTAPYTAPEYALRRAPDLRADLYSVGVLLFQLLARRPPYEGKEPAALLQAQLQRDAPPLKSMVAGAPAPISDFIQRLLSRDPQGRFESPQQALAALQAAVGPAFPELAWPPPGSDAQAVAREADYLRLFRRVALQGGRWAIQAPPAGGKTHLAHWLERLLWFNQKNVLRLSGESLSLVQGEVSLNPAFPTYLIIDDADRAATEAWLSARPYGHVIALGRDMTWAKKTMGWYHASLRITDLRSLTAFVERTFGKVEGRAVAAMQKHFQGIPGPLVLGAEALQRQGLLRREAGAWKLDGEKFQRAAEGPQAAQLGAPLASLPEAQRAILARLALVPVPWRRGDLPAEGEWEAWSRASWIRRRVKGGEEYYQSNLPPVAAAESGFTPGQIAELLREVGRRGWPAAALEGYDRFFSSAMEPERLLLRAELTAESGRYAETLTLVSADLVKALPPEQKGLAFEIFGLALAATGKDKQAEAALKSAFPAYKTPNDPAGQARVLILMGELLRRAGDNGRALQCFQQALGAAATSNEPERWRGETELAIARVYVAATDFEGAETHFQGALAALETARRGDALARAYARYAEHCLQQNDPDRAEIFCHEALGWALFHEAAPTQAEIFATWATILRHREDMRGAAGKLGEAVETLARQPETTAYAQALLARADFLESQRELEPAQKDSRAAFEAARRLKSPGLEGETLLVVGKIQSRDLEKLDAAKKSLQGARTLLQQAGNRKKLWECDFQLGEIERFHANPTEARAHYQRAAQTLDAILAELAPQSFDAEQLGKRRREIDMAMQVMG